MSEVERVVSGLNFNLLRHQKLALLKCTDPKTGSLVKNVLLYAGDLDGIINMIDSIQDAVVEDGIKTEAEVFGEEVNDESSVSK